MAPFIHSSNLIHPPTHLPLEVRCEGVIPCSRCLRLSYPCRPQESRHNRRYSLMELVFQRANSLQVRGGGGGGGGGGDRGGEGGDRGRGGGKNSGGERKRRRQTSRPNPPTHPLTQVAKMYTTVFKELFQDNVVVRTLNLLPPIHPPTQPTHPPNSPTHPRPDVLAFPQPNPFLPPSFLQPPTHPTHKDSSSTSFEPPTLLSIPNPPTHPPTHPLTTSSGPRPLPCSALAT